MAFNILIVDDSRVMRRIIKKSIQLSGVPVANFFEAPNGREGLKALQAGKIDFVFLDLNMPVLNGEEMIAAMRASPDTARIPVVVISTESSAHKVARLGGMVAGFVHKPFSPELLRQVIIKMVGEDNVDGSKGGDAPGRCEEF